MTDADRPLKILYHHRTLSGDGQAIHIDAVTRSLGALGHDVIMVSPGQAQAAGQSDDNGWSKLRMLLPNFVGELLEIVYSLRAEIRLIRAIRSANPDILYERYSLFLMAGVRAARKAGLPIIMEVNAPLADERRAHSGLGLYRLARWLEVWTWRQADHIIAVSQVLADHIAASGVAKDRITILHNGVFEDRIVPPAPVAPDTSRTAPVTICFVGFARPWHALDRVLRAMRHTDLHHVHFRLVGGGPTAEALKADAAKMGLASRCVFVGDVAADQVADALAGTDIGLLPAVTGYASPLKLFDYMAAGLAIIGPDQPNIREIVTDGETALLFPPDPHSPESETSTDMDSGAAPSMEALIIRLCRDDDLRRALAQKASAQLHKGGHLWHSIAARTIEIARSLLQKRSP